MLNQPILRDRKGNRSTSKGISFDPRIKLMLLMLVSIFLLGGAGGKAMSSLRLILCILPAILLMSAQKWGKAALYGIAYFLCEIVQIYVLKEISGIANFLLLMAVGTVCRFLPSFILTYYIVSTTNVNELLAGLKKLYVPDKITIPIAVMFRFFPTLEQEHKAISDTMKMRGIHIGGKKFTKLLEYRLIPLMSCSVKIGDELSAAALTRGLGAPCKRTDICEVNLKVQDYIIFIVCAVTILWAVVSSFGL